MFHRLLFCLVLFLISAPAYAVVILDSTWIKNGGSKASPANGFGPAIALARQEQFRSLVALSADRGNTWGDCSGVWIGNSQNHGYILTAAHCFGKDSPPSGFMVRTQGGSTLAVVGSVIHEKWVDVETTTGYDLAILRVSRPIEDAGSPPNLYGGKSELKKVLTFMGYGMRGIASIGENVDFHDGRVLPAAAQGIIDVVEDQEKYLGVFFPAENGSIKNPYGGSNLPFNSLVGALGSGDSGGPAWIKINDKWVLAGINSNGTGKSEAGESSYFVRISANQAWITKNAPMVRFVR